MTSKAKSPFKSTLSAGRWDIADRATGEVLMVGLDAKTASAIVGGAQPAGQADRRSWAERYEQDHCPAYDYLSRAA